jgi:capsular exopolysaccharide synthesis family protein
MTQKTAKNFYELLNIPPWATEDEIDSAYVRAKIAYGGGSAGAFSHYSSRERETMLRTIVKAYETLKNPVKRRAYNTRLSGTQQQGHHKLNVNAAQNNSVIKEIHAVKEPEHNIRLKKPLVVMGDIDPLVAEQYRILYTKLEQISHKNSYKSFAITSSLKEEGKTITAFNLAYMMAREFKKKVILVECDLKNPSITSNFLDAQQEYGLVDVIKRAVALDVAITRLENSSLYLLLAPRIARNSLELVGSPRMEVVMNTLKTQFDYVIVDAPPILHIADMNFISRIVDGLVLVVRAGKTPKDLVLKAVNSLSNGNMVGIILNSADISLRKYYY